MAGSPNANRTQISFLGLHDPSGATGPLFGADDSAAADVFGTVFVPRRLILVGVEAFNAAESVVVTWRPTPGSATGAITVVDAYAIPNGFAIGQIGIVDLNFNDNAAVTVGAASPNGQFGIAGSFSRAGETFQPLGPGGEFLFADTGSSTAGQVNVYIEYEMLSLANEAQSNTVTQLVIS